MCGIHLIIDKKKQLDSFLFPSGETVPYTEKMQQHPIGKMLQSAFQRGPDFSASVSIAEADRNIFIGSNRLKIIGTEDAANQPFLTPDKKYLLAYNGAIYNFYDLRNQLLGQGTSFRTASDTEVLMYWLNQKGEDGLAKLKGMFAFIWYDTEKKKFLLARDQQGMKPLFYFENEDYFIASSEISGILQSDLVQKELNEKQIYYYLQFKYAQRPETFYKGVFELEPGTCLDIVSSEVSSISDFVQKSNFRKEILIEEEKVLEKTEELLTQSVLEHLIADVPTGIFLSGGVDSTLLLALLHKNGAMPVPSYTVFGTDAGSSFNTKDHYYAKKAAKQYGSIYHEVGVNADILNGIEDLAGQLDQPIGDSASVLTLALSEKAKESVKVILSGAGADELFGGYHRHQAYYWYLKNYKIFKNGFSFGKSLINFLPDGFDHPLRNHFRLMKKLGKDATSNKIETFLNFTSFPSFRKTGDAHIDLQSSLPGNENEDYLAWALQHDQSHYLISDVLAVNDRMSMAQSIEMRMPYLDKDLAKFANQLPARYRLSQGKKWILKKLLKKLNGAIYVNRKKEGFGLPFGAWLQSEAYNKVKPYFEDQSGVLFNYVEYDKIRHLLDQHREKKQDNTTILWSILVLSSWLEKKFPK